MPENSWGDFQSFTGYGDVTNNTDYSNFLGGLGSTLGFEGNMFNEAPMNYGYNESMGGDFWGTGQQISPEFLQQLQGLSFNPVQGADDPSVDVSRNGQQIGSYRYGSSPGTASKLMAMAIPALVTAGFGSGLGTLFGGGAFGMGAGNALATGGMTAARGGDSSQIGTSMFSSALGSGLGALNPAGVMGLEGGFAKAANAGIGNAVGTGLRGGSGQDMLTSGLQGSLVSGLNSAGSNMASSFGDLWNSFGGGDTEFDQLEGSGGNFDQRQDPYGSNTYDEASPDFRFSGDFAPVGMKTAQSAGTGAGDSGGGLASFMPSGGQVGNFLGNNAGDLAAMLYGFYNNKKQQKALQGQQEGLQGLYAQNSPYATQLRNQLQAKAAAGGKRLNTSGRETQLQAMLADRAAQMAPTMYQMQQGQNNLQNNNMNMLLQGANKLGAFKALGNGLQGMFNQPSLTGPGSMQAYGQMDNMYSNMPWSD